MTLIAFSGIPCSGKSTMARLAHKAILGEYGDAMPELVDEYARKYIAQHSAPVDLSAQSHIFHEQYDKELGALGRSDIVVTDSPLFLNYAYSMDVARRLNLKDSLELRHMYSLIKNHPYLYSVVFHLSPLDHVEDDGVRPSRHLELQWRGKMDRLLIEIAEHLYGGRVVIVKHGSIEERISCIMNVLGNLLKNSLALHIFETLKGPP